MTLITEAIAVVAAGTFTAATAAMAVATNRAYRRRIDGGFAELAHRHSVVATARAAAQPNDHHGEETAP